MSAEVLRSSDRNYSAKKAVLKHFEIFIGKHLCCNFIKNRLQNRCFSVNIAKFLRTPTLKNICQRLLLSPEYNSAHQSSSELDHKSVFMGQGISYILFLAGFSSTLLVVSSNGQISKMMLFQKKALREKSPNTELFLIHIFLYSIRIQENTDQK